MPSNLLINEPPLQVLPTLAKLIGLNEAMVLQQLHYWLSNPRVKGITIEDEKYILNTYSDWGENFPFWSEITIKRIFLSLEKQNLVISKQPYAKKHDRTKAYRIQYDTLERINLIPSKGSNRYDVNMNPENPNGEKPENVPDGTNINWPLEWKLAHEEEITEDDLITDAEQFVNDAKDAAFLICQNNLQFEPLAMAFMITRRIILPFDKTSQTGHRKALKKMYDARPNQVKPEHVKQAVINLLSINFTVTDLWSIVKTAIDLANPPPETNQEIERPDENKIKELQDYATKKYTQN